MWLSLSPLLKEQRTISTGTTALECAADLGAARNDACLTPSRHGANPRLSAKEGCSAEKASMPLLRAGHQSPRVRWVCCALDSGPEPLVETGHERRASQLTVLASSGGSDKGGEPQPEMQPPKMRNQSRPAMREGRRRWNCAPKIDPMNTARLPRPVLQYWFRNCDVDRCQSILI